MKKLFLLIPAFLLSLAINATVINITPTSPYESHDNLRLALHYANPGDEIVLADGTYLEKDDYLYFNKNITVRAAEGASPVIDLFTYAQIKNGANVHIEGLKFNGAAQGSYDYYIRFYDDSETSLVLEGCEFYNVKNIVITGKETTHTNSLTVNNCFFHNNQKQAIYFYPSSTEGRQTIDALTVTNSTFANTAALTNWISIIDVRPWGSEGVYSDIQVTVDHCTFYNNPCVDSGHANIRTHQLSNVAISNCIFMHPTELAQRATYCDGGGTISNCIAFNFTKDPINYSHAYGATVTDCRIVNPLFVDPANNDFTLHNASPARHENGTVFGDPRWAKAIEPITIPTTLQPIDAMLSDSAGIIAGTPDSIEFKVRGNRSYTDLEWAKWKVTPTKDGQYNFIAYTQRSKSTGGQKFEIAFLNADETEFIPTRQDNNMANIDTIQTGIVTLEAGKTYIFKLRNIYNWAESKLISVEANYLGGTTINLPATLLPVDALRSEHAQLIHGTVDTLTFARLDHEWEADDEGYTVEGSQYVKWNINIQKAGKYKFTANTYCTQGHNYRMILLSENEASTIGMWLEKDDISQYDFHTNVDYPVSTPVLDLTPGNYVFKMQAREKGRVMSVIASYEGGAISNVPGQLICEDAVLEATKMSHNADRDIAYGDNGNPRNEYAYWNIHAEEACNLTVSFDIAPGSTSGHEFVVELRNTTEKLDSVEETTLSKYLSIPSAGDYTLRLINRRKWSSTILHGITFTPYVAPSAVVMTDTDTDNSAWISELNNTVNVQLNRTILGGMYNTICLPFKVSEAKCKEIFGDDVELYTLGSAEISGDILNLNFNPASDIWNGTPIMIKTSHDIVNPTFEGVIIESQQGATTPKNAANFKGTFVQQQFHAGDQVLLLMANNAVVIPQSDKTLKGFRAYFQINANSANIPSRARIVLQNQTATDMEIVAEKEAEPAKLIENGQLIIIKNGVRYNAQGQIIQ